MERKIGEVFEFEGMQMQCLKAFDMSFPCRGCYFLSFCRKCMAVGLSYQSDTALGLCWRRVRSDGQDVIFRPVNGGDGNGQEKR